VKPVHTTGTDQCAAYFTTPLGFLKSPFSHLRKYDTLLLRRKPGERKMGIYGVTENESAISDIGNSI
jgi:hypothetical protein